jgi:TP901 family phage tail tape measure protein
VADTRLSRIVEIVLKINDQTASGLQSFKTNTTDAAEAQVKLSKESGSVGEALHKQTEAAKTVTSAETSVVGAVTQAASAEQRQTDVLGASVIAAGRAAAAAKAHAEALARQVAQAGANISASGRAAYAAKQLGDSQSWLANLFDKVRTAASGAVNSIKNVGHASEETASKVKSSEGALHGFESVLGEILALSASLATVGFPVVKAAEFQKAIGEVGAIAEATDAQLTKLADAAKRAGRETEFSAVESAGALKLLAAAGFTVDESITALPSVLDLAVAGMVDLATATDIATSILSAMGKPVSELSAVNDVLVKTTLATNAEMTDLGTAMKYVAPIAAGLGVSLEDLSAAMGILHNAGIKGSMAGTVLRGTIEALMNPTAQEAELMDQLSARIGGSGLQVKDARGNFVGFLSLIEQLEKASIGADEALKLFGARSGPGMAAMVLKGSPALKKLLTDLENCQGVAHRTAEELSKSLFASAKHAGNAFEGLAIELGTHLLPVLTSLMHWVANIVNAITDWAIENKKLTEVIVYVVSALVGLAAAVTGWGIAVKAASLLTSSFAGQAIGGLITGVKNLVAAFPLIGTAVKAVGGVVAAAFLGWEFGKWLTTIQLGTKTIGDYVQQLYARLAVFFNEVSVWWNDTFYYKPLLALNNMSIEFYTWLTTLIEKVKSVPILGSLFEGIGTEAIDILKAKINEFVLVQQQLTTERGAEASALEQQKALYQSIVADIDAEAKKKQELAVEHEKDIELRREIQKTTAEMEVTMRQMIEDTNKQIEASGKAQEAAEKDLEAQKTRYGALSELANGALSNIQAANDLYLSIVQDTNQKIIDSDTATAQQKIATISDGVFEAEQLAEREANIRIDLAKHTLDVFQGTEEERREQEKRVAEEIVEINRETTEEKIKLYQEAAGSLEKLLADSIKKEEELQKELNKLLATGADAYEDLENRKQDILDKTRTELEKYNRAIQEYNDTMTEAGKAFASGDFEKAIELYREAGVLASELTGAVKDGTEEIISEEQTTKSALEMIEKAQVGVAEATEAGADSTRQAMADQEQASGQYRNALEDVKATLEDLAERAKEGIYAEVIAETKRFDETMRKIMDTETKYIEVKAKVEDALRDIERLKAQLAGIQNKTVTITTVHKDVEAKASGGLAGVFRRMVGTLVPGIGNRDSVPAMLMPGEYVVKRSSVRKYGLGILEAINNGLLELPRFAFGGYVNPHAAVNMIPKDFPKIIGVKNLAESIDRLNSVLNMFKVRQVDLTEFSNSLQKASAQLTTVQKTVVGQKSILMEAETETQKSATDYNISLPEELPTKETIDALNAQAQKAQADAEAVLETIAQINQERQIVNGIVAKVAAIPDELSKGYVGTEQLATMYGVNANAKDIADAWRDKIDTIFAEASGLRFIDPDLDPLREQMIGLVDLFENHLTKTMSNRLTRYSEYRGALGRATSSSSHSLPTGTKEAPHVEAFNPSAEKSTIARTKIDGDKAKLAIIREANSTVARTTAEFINQVEDSDSFDNLRDSLGNLSSAVEDRTDYELPDFPLDTIAEDVATSVVEKKYDKRFRIIDKEIAQPQRYIRLTDVRESDREKFVENWLQKKQREKSSLENDRNDELRDLVDELRKRWELLVPRYSSGGRVDGVGSSDNQLSWLTPGEFVIKKNVVAQLGTGFFNALNNLRIPKFALGGVVGPVSQVSNEQTMRVVIQTERGQAEGHFTENQAKQFIRLLELEGLRS